ncbi:hypothetical protein BH24CHL5_BH24CHL5_02140 [soil metagenome]
MLIAANLVPLVGVVWFGWDVTTVLLAYWLENGIVGLLNVPKMLLAGGKEQPLSAVGAVAGIGGWVALTLFFVVHYGIFWLVLGVFVIVLAGGALASHAVSFWLNYIGRGEYRNASLGGQMFAPYPRMVVLHLTIVLGGAVLIGMGQPILLVALLVVFKTVADLGLHVAERRRQGGRQAPATV